MIFFVSNHDEESIAINLFVIDNLELKELLKQYPNYKII